MPEFITNQHGFTWMFGDAPTWEQEHASELEQAFTLWQHGVAFCIVSDEIQVRDGSIFVQGLPVLFTHPVYPKAFVVRDDRFGSHKLGVLLRLAKIHFNEIYWGLEPAGFELAEI